MDNTLQSLTFTVLCFAEINKSFLCWNGIKSPFSFDYKVYLLCYPSEQQHLPHRCSLFAHSSDQTCYFYHTSNNKIHQISSERYSETSSLV